MTAMENATNNADDVISNLTIVYNKSRQAMITSELMDIVNGTEALSKGGSE
jgi:F-type H+-transporting ATPase subunit gamma